MEEWESFIAVKGSRCALTGGGWPGVTAASKYELGVLHGYGLGVHVWLSLVGAKVEGGVKIKEAVNY